jgi:hypothetical protein
MEATKMEDKQIREIITILREAVAEKNWDKVEWMIGVLNMHTIDAVFEEEFNYGFNHAKDILPQED